MRLRNTLLVASAACAAISSTLSAATLAPLSSFGGGDGWRAPGEVIAGDTAGTANAPNITGYNYLQTGSLERGLDYNPTTGNLILVSRSTAGNGLRVLSGTSGADVGFLNQGTGVITGGTFTTSTVGVANDGAIYVGNLTTNAATTPFKLYRFANEAGTATTVFSSALAAARLGDSLDITGSGAGTRVAAGYGSGAAGYAIIDPTAGTGVSVQTFAPNDPATGDFRLGITFAGTDSDVWGKQTGAGRLLRRTSYSGTAGTSNGSNALTSDGEAPMDYATIGGTPYLASLDINNSLVRIYNATNPSALALVASLTTTSGTLAGNGNAVGSVAWGAIDNANLTATLYAMSSNQGIQAFTFTADVPEPATLSVLAGAAVMGLRRRRR